MKNIEKHEIRYPGFGLRFLDKIYRANTGVARYWLISQRAERRNKNRKTFMGGLW